MIEKWLLCDVSTEAQTIVIEDSKIICGVFLMFYSFLCVFINFQGSINSQLNHN